MNPSKHKHNNLQPSSDRKFSPASVIRLFSMGVLMVAIFGVPLCVKAVPVLVKADYQNLWYAEGFFDLFALAKSQMILGLGASAILSILFGLIFKTFKFKLDFFKIGLMVIGILAIVAALLSRDKQVALWGFYERQEGLLVFLAYLVLAMLVNVMAPNKREQRILMGTLLMSGVLMTVIALLQMIEVDITAFLNTLWGGDAGYLDKITMMDERTTAHVKAAYGTLYNPNPYGMYMAIMFGLALGYWLTIKKDPLVHYASMTVILFIFVGLLLSFSRAALLASGAALVASGLLNLGALRDRWKSATLLTVLMVIAVFGINYWSQGDLIGRMAAFNMDQQVHVEDAAIDKIKDITIDKNRVRLIATGVTLEAVFEGGTWTFYDEAGSLLNLQDDSRFEHYEITISDGFLKVVKGKSFLIFVCHEGQVMWLDRFGKAISLEPADSLGFEGKERMGSGRGYIWSRTLPLIVQQPLLGYGLDVFPTVFPQTDFIGKLRYMYDANLLIDKPHSWWLHYAMGFGLPGVMVFAALIINGILVSMRLWLKPPTGTQRNAPIAFACALGLLGWLVTSFFTDSTVGVGPLVFILLGLGSTWGRNSFAPK